MTDCVSPSSADPVVSIGIPTFNREILLRRAVESVLAQDYSRIELIISDNASTDGTENLGRAFAARDSRVIYHRNPTNQGPTYNFNRALMAATGELFMWLGDDDWIDSTYIRLCVKNLIEDSATSMVAGIAKYYQDGTFVRSGRRINILSDSPFIRVLRYYRAVSDNGVFYGVRRRNCGLNMQLQSGVGADWLFVAGLAFSGRIRTIANNSIHREYGGLSKDRKRSAKELQIPRMHVLLPLVAVAKRAFSEVLAGKGPYLNLSVPVRIAFATTVFGQLFISKSIVMNLQGICVRLIRFTVGETAYQRLRRALVR